MFEEWALNNGYRDDLTIDRIDETGNYCPENCRWVLANNNSRYKSTTNLIDVDGEMHTGREWAVILQLGAQVINTYVRKYGMDNTVEFIRRYRENPKPRSNITQSYYNMYMEQTKS